MVSIVIPTVKFEQLKPCLESIQKYTDLEIGTIRIIVVANGMSQEAKAYLEGYYSSGAFGKSTFVWHDKMLGYPKACNAGIKAAGNDHIILLNDDIALLPQDGNTWINMLQAPLKDPTVGITGPIAGENSFAVFFCVAIRRELIDKIGGNNASDT